MSRHNKGLLPTFQLNLGDPIRERGACVGRFDGVHPSLVCSTAGGKLFVYSPHDADARQGGQSLRYLNLSWSATDCSPWRPQSVPPMRPRCARAKSTRARRGVL